MSLATLRRSVSEAEAQQAPPASSLPVSLWTLYVLTLRQYVHGKRWMVLGILFLLPPGLALVIRATAEHIPRGRPEFLLVFMFIPQALLPLLALIYASGMLQDEQEEQTITYLLVRPIPKWAIYLVKLLATLTTTVILTVVFTILTYLAIYVGAADVPADIVSRAIKAAGIHSLAVVAYCCLFGLFSLLTKRILVLGIVYIAIVEGVLANLPFGIRIFTVIYYTRLIAYRLLYSLSEVGRVHRAAAEAWQLDIRKDPNLLEHPQLQTCFLVLAIASASCAIIAAFLCTRREFHVKTPEKAGG
jgi:ABC-2 type transport system permease protein